jgi:cobalamin biosynthesis Mg chelatase CobN
MVVLSLASSSGAGSAESDTAAQTCDSLITLNCTTTTADPTTEPPATDPPSSSTSEATTTSRDTTITQQDATTTTEGASTTTELTTTSSIELLVPGAPVDIESTTTVAVEPTTDADNTGKIVFFVVAGLLVVAALLTLLTIAYWRHTRPAPPASSVSP